MKTRNEMNPEYLWDLSHIFKDDSAWESACADAELAINAVSEVQGTLGNSAEDMKKGIIFFIVFLIIIGLYMFVLNKYLPSSVLAL